MSSWHDQIRVHQLVYPAALRGLTNGNLPAAALVAVTNGNGKVIGRLEATAARAWTAMCAVARADHGTILDATDTYRPRSEQDRIWNERYDHTNHGLGGKTCGGDHRFLKPHCAVVACPGDSNHGWGLALDDRNQTPETGLYWLEAHAQTFGFQWEVPSEVWHLQYWPGDQIPQAVLDYEAHLNPVQEDIVLYNVADGPNKGWWLIVGNVRRAQTKPGSADHLIAARHTVHEISGEGFAQIAAMTELSVADL